MAAQPPPEPPRGKHVTSRYAAAQVRPTDGFRPDRAAQVTQTAGTNPAAPADRQAAPEISPTVPYAGDSPTGYDPYTMSTF